MPLPPDPELTKLRIKADRARRVFQAANDEAIRLRWAYEEEWMKYVRHGKALGYCVFCELKKADCRCIFVAGTE